MREARKAHGMTQADLARQCGCSVRFVSEVERGKKTAELGKSLNLLVALGVPLTAGWESRIDDGRAQVNYAVSRIASDLEAKPQRRRKLGDYLGEGD